VKQKQFIFTHTFVNMEFSLVIFTCIYQAFSDNVLGKTTSVSKYDYLIIYNRM